MRDDAPLVGADALVELADVYEACGECPLLCKNRKGVVFGDGSASARILIVGEAPGEEEDEAGIAFWGKAGRLLMELLRVAWPDQETISMFDDLWDDDLDANAEYWDELRNYFNDYIFWTNVVLCHPPKRPPLKKEINACRDRLVRTIYAVDPDIIFAMGKIPATVLLGKTVAITKMAGDPLDIQIPSPATGDPVRYSMVPVFQPSFLLRKGDEARIKHKEGFHYDVLQMLEKHLNLLEDMHQQSFGTSFLERDDS